MDAVIQMLPESLRRFSTYIDFVGQHNAERHFQIVIVLASIIGFIVGYVMQQVSISFSILGVGFLVANLIVLVPWPWYRQNPIHWLPVKEQKDEPAPKKAAPTGGNKKDNKKKQ